MTLQEMLKEHPELKDALDELFESEDDAGCTDDVTVVSKPAVNKLRRMFVRVRDPWNESW